MARRHRVVSIVGTRPEAIKMAPVADALAGAPALDHQVVLTGQHAGLAGAMRDVALELPPDGAARSPARLRERLHGLLTPELLGLAPDLVLVHGDTSSAFAGALAARDCGIPVGHVEAGLRSFDIRQPWPEEGNRIAIDALSELLFAPTEAAAANLRVEKRVRGAIHVTGNTGIDAVLREAARIPAQERVRPGALPLVLVTCHRKENQGARGAAVCRAVRAIAGSLACEVAFILHTNPLVRADLAPRLAGARNVRLIEPLAYRAMVRLMTQATLILTDSGGLQEEGPALGKPVLVLRDVTERPEALGSRHLELVGTDSGAIVTAVADLLADPARLLRLSSPAFPFGDGRAAHRIAAAIGRWLEARRTSLFTTPRGAAARAGARAPQAPPLAAR